jgi:acylphosphatase
MSDGVVRRRVRLTGRVQGVWFRDSTRAVADDNGVAGWVHNRSDGSVEATLEGPADAVARVIAWCHHGPPRARVERVEVSEEEPEGLTGSFEVR